MIRNDNQLFYWLTVILTMSALLILQAGLFSNFSVINVSANLTLLFVIIVSMVASIKHTLIISFMGGFLLDLLSGTPDGVFVLSMLLTAFAVYFVVNNFLSSTNNNLALYIIVISATLIFELLALLFLLIFAWLITPSHIDAARILMVHAPLSLLWNLLLAYPMFFVYHFISNKFSKVEA